MKFCKIHYGRESLNKEKYMFDNIGRAEGKVLLLVPDQFTLQAEKEAFFYLKTNSLSDVEVVSFTRLGARILAETGGSLKARIDECGRFMLITKLASENEEKLKILRNSARFVSFAQMANDLIYEMKQYNTAPERLSQVIDSIGDDVILKQKLIDVNLLYNKYEEYTKEKYLDGEDYIELFTSKIGDSDMVRESAIWVYGFDYFTPKNMGVLNELMKYARELNVAMTYADDGPDKELFALTGGVVGKLKQIAEQSGVGFDTYQVPEAYKKEKSESLSAVEKELFSLPVRACFDRAGITLLKAANLHSEIESAAAYVAELVREHGLKYKDIAIVCNDTDERARIARRVLAEYGIDVFIDRKRSFTHDPAVRFILSLLNIVINGYRSFDIFSMLKTDMAGIKRERYEELENYSVKYKIRGARWKSEFKKGREEYGETFAEIEESRSILTEFLANFERPFKKAKTARQKTTVLYEFLIEAEIHEKLEEMAVREAEKGLHEYAEETAQTWKNIINIFDQLVEIMGDEEMSSDDFAGVLKVGFESVEVGVLPPAADGLVLGTMQRMRLGRIKALIIFGANEGVLPAAMAKEGLLNDDEKDWLFGQNVEICRREELRLKEEQIAIYKNMSKPEEYLWVSYSISDLDGGRLTPSPIFEKLKDIFPELEIQEDVISRGEPNHLIQSKESTLKHLANSMRDCIALEKEPRREWRQAAQWYRKNMAEQYKLIVDGLFYKNSESRLESGRVRELYGRGREEIIFSPSRLERYGKCPFSFFVDYGLRPEEIRVFEIAGREVGDIYHNCIMRFSKKLTGNSPGWMEITKEESDEMINSLIDDEAYEYREGVFSQGNEEAYRTDRIKDVCRENAWVLVQHVRNGNIKSMAFEEKFGQSGGAFPPIEVELQDGKKALIEGKIDRVDVLADDSVKIIDYKSGRERFSVAEAKAGWRLQLMLYLEAAQGRYAEPAGVFYYTIDEKAEAGRMDGVVVNKASVIDNIAGDFENYSNIIPVRKLKDGSIKGNSGENLLSEAEFGELQSAVNKKVKELCNMLMDGRIDISPKRSGNMTACTYCGFKSVCGFDISFDGFRYENI